MASIAALATLLNTEALLLDETRGQHLPLQVAVIDEQYCIGCTLCIQACPVDAIVGASKLMHTVLTQACTGCDLCVAPCPVDCIEMVAVAPARAWTRSDAQASRQRFEARNARLARPSQEPPTQEIAPDIGNAVAQALAKARARRAASRTS